MSGFSELTGILRGLALPPQSLFLLLLIGLLLRLRWPRLGRNMAALALALIYLLATPAVAHLLLAPLERFAPPLTRTEGTGAEAIVVLAAGRLADAPEYDGQDIPDYIALARLRYAARLHRATGLPVLVSGGGASKGREPFAIGMARALRNEFRVPVRWIEAQSFNTAENAAFSARILEKSGLRQILLVTDAMHMRRSVMAFTQAGMTVVAAPTVFFSAGIDPLHPSQFLPTVEGLRRSHYALYQWLGIAWYGWHYEMPIWSPGFD